jgi:hypothetical protein
MGANADSGGIARDVGDAARRRAWAEMARVLGEQAAGGSAIVSGKSAGAANAGAAGATDAASGKMITDSVSLSLAASNTAADRDARAHDAGDQVFDNGANDRTFAATLAGTAFGNGRAGADHGNSAGRDGTGPDGAGRESAVRDGAGRDGGRNSDAFASYAASIGRGAGDSLSAGASTTTTGFTLPQVTTVLTTTTLTDALHTGTATSTPTPSAGTGAAAPGSTSAATLPPSLAAAGDVDGSQNVLRSMRLQWNGSVGEAQLRLEPEHLGQVLVSVRVDQGNVSATLHADSATAQQWIESHQQDLRQALQDQGLKVTHFHVTVNPDDRGRRDASPQQHQQSRDQESSQAGRSRTPRDTSGGRTFEVRV